MDLETLKMHLGALTLSTFQEAGFIPLDEEDPDGLVMRVTSPEHNKKFNEVMWASSINNDEGRFAILMHAILYDSKTAKKLGRPAEVAQVCINKSKATMILDAIRHAYPELFDSQRVIEDVEGCQLEEFVDEEENEEIDLFDEENEELDLVDDDVCDLDSCSICGEPLEELPDSTALAKEIDSDCLIDAHLLIKDKIQKTLNNTCEVQQIKVAEPHTYLYVASPEKDKLILSIDELDVVAQVNEAINDPLIISEEAAKLLLLHIKSAYPNLENNEK